MRLRESLERILEGWGFTACRLRWLILVATVGLVAGAGTCLGDLRVEMSLKSYLPEDDETRLEYDAFLDLFGSDEQLLVLVRTSSGVFDLRFLERLRRLHNDLERNLPYVGEVRSLLNARRTYGTEDALIVEDLFEHWPESEGELRTIEAVARENPLYDGLYLLEEGRSVAVIIEVDATAGRPFISGGLVEHPSPVQTEGQQRSPGDMLTGEETKILISAIYEVLDRHKAEGMEIHVAGSRVTDYQFTTRLPANMKFFTVISFVLIAGLLFLLFRRLSGVFLPLVVAFLSIVTSLALMAILDRPVTAITQVLPSFLLVVGIGDSVHILSIFFRRHSLGEPRDRAIAYALRESGFAVLMTSITTAASLSSFAAADILPIADLGVVAPLGVMVALAFSIVLLPALLAILPLKNSGEAVVPPGITARPGQRRFLHRGLLWLGSLGCRRPVPVLVGWGIIAFLSAVGLTRLHFSHDPLSWFRQDDPFAQETRIVNRATHGLFSLDILIDTGVEYGLHDPDVLRAMDQAARLAEKAEVGGLTVGKAISLADIVKETNQALHEGRADQYRIPDGRPLVAQELFLFEIGGMDDLERMTDSRFSIGRLTVLVPAVDAYLYPPFMDSIIGELKALVGEKAAFHGTGTLALMGRAFRAVVLSMMKSYVLAFGLIAILMVAILGDLRTGLIAMIPNLTPILVTLGIMGWCGIPLHMGTILLGSIAIGIAVDDTIHFMHHFRRHQDETRDVSRAVEATLATTGEALLFTSLVLTAGFLVYTLGDMLPAVHFGLVNGVAVVFAFLADVLLVPALMTLLPPKA